MRTLLAIAIAIAIGGVCATTTGMMLAQAEPLVPAATNADPFQWFYDRAISGNTLHRYIDGQETLDDRIALIRSAKHTILFSTFEYIWDGTTHKFSDILCEKAQDPKIDVRMVIDSYGGSTFRPYLNQYRRCGIKIMYAGDTHFGPFEKLYASHDKLLIIDGQTVIIGGSGISDYYRDYGPRSKVWHDYDFKIGGPVACWFHKTFVHNWQRSMSRGRANPYPVTEWGDAAKREASWHFVEQLYGSFEIADCDYQNRGDIKILPVYNNPYFDRERPILDAEVKAVLSSQKQVWLYGAYFVAHPGLVDAILKVRKKGVPVTVITNSPWSNDDLKISVPAMYRKMRPLIDAGVDIRLWKPKATLHRKGGIFDRRLVLFGSDNLDIRGQNWSSESVAFTDNRQAVDDMYQEFEDDIAKSIPLTDEWIRKDWKSRPLYQKIGTILLWKLI